VSGDETYTVGRFINHEGKQQNTPCVRFGNIAMMPLEPIRMKYSAVGQECFLIEAHSLGGFSGSPVFVALTPSPFREDEKVRELSSGNGYLLGVACGHSFDWERTKESDRNSPTEDGRGITLNTGLMCVIPAWRLRDLLHSPALISERAAEFKKRCDGDVMPD
jgi:hypothetical protein